MIPVLHGVWAAAGGAVGDFELIETQTVGAGGVASITFSSIPGTYKHLQIRGIIRTERVNPSDGMRLQINGDTGNNYVREHYLTGDGTNATSGFTNALNYIDFNRATASQAASGLFGAFIMDIVDYGNTAKYKTTRNLGGYDANGSGSIYFESGLWMSTSAITSLKYYSGSANLAQYTSISLYGER